MNQGVEAGQDRRFHRVLSVTFGLCCNSLLIATFLLAASPVLAVSSLEFEVTWTSLDVDREDSRYSSLDPPGRGSGTLPLKDGKFDGYLSSSEGKIHVSGQLIGQSLGLIGKIQANRS